MTRQGGTGDDVIIDGEANAALVSGFGGALRAGTNLQTGGDGWLRDVNLRRAPAHVRQHAGR